VARLDHEALRRMMGEAAALPPDDEFRRQVEASVAAAGNWAEEEWLALLRFDEEMRLSLLQLPVPPQLEPELRTIAETGPHRRPWFSWPAPARVAGIVLLVILVSAGAFLLQGRRATRGAIQELATLTMNEHSKPSPLGVETSNRGELERLLAGTVSFPVIVPELDGQFELVGGRRCTLGQKVVVYSHWSRSDRRYSLYQFRPDDFGIPHSMESTYIPGRSGCDVTVWTQQGCGFALVGGPGAQFSPDRE